MTSAQPNAAKGIEAGAVADVRGLESEVRA